MVVLLIAVAAAVLLPTVAILHATQTPSNESADNDNDHHDQNHHEQDHDDNETSDDNSVTHADLDDPNENETDIDTD